MLGKQAFTPFIYTVPERVRSMDRDTLFAGNPELYYTIGNASTIISVMALPMSGILKGATGAAKFKTIAVDGGRILIGNVAEDKVYDVIYQSTDSRILAMLEAIW